MAIKLIKEDNNRWILWDKDSGQCIDIFATDSMFMGDHQVQYSVVYCGKRLAGCVDDFTEARRIAKKHLESIA